MFLGDACPCGWALDPVSDTEKLCVKCNRHFLKKDWGWDQITARDQVKHVDWCRHRYEAGQYCPHCPDNVAVYWPHQHRPVL